MTRAEFRAAVVGRTIAGVEFPDRDDFGRPIEDGRWASVAIGALILDDGSRIELSGSAQVEVAQVDATIYPPGTGGVAGGRQ